MIIAKLNIKKFLLILLIFFIYPANILLANDQIIKVYYSGFTFSNTYDSNKTYTKYTADLIKEKNPDTGIDIISSKLLETIKKFNVALQSFKQTMVRSQFVKQFGEIIDYVF